MKHGYLAWLQSPMILHSFWSKQDKSQNQNIDCQMHGILHTDNLYQNGVEKHRDSPYLTCWSQQSSSETSIYFYHMSLARL